MEHAAAGSCHWSRRQNRDAQIFLWLDVFLHVAGPILKDSLAPPQLFGFSLVNSLPANLPDSLVAQMGSGLAEQHGKPVFLGPNLLRLTPISGLVLGNWQKSRVWKAKISPKGGG